MFWGSQESGALSYSLFTLYVNPALIIDNVQEEKASKGGVLMEVYRKVERIILKNTET